MARGTYCAFLYVLSLQFTYGYIRNYTLYDVISEDNRFRKISTMIEDAGLSLFFEESHITAFIPTTEALLTFDDKQYGYDLQDRDTVRSLLLYHMVTGTYLTGDLPGISEAQTLHPAKHKVYFNQLLDHNEKVYTVNGAIILLSNITASNGILHVIDRVMAPVTSSKTLHDYILYPELPHFSFSSINNASIVDLDLKKMTTDSSQKFTVFLPDDGHLVSMPTYGQDKLFKDWYLVRKVYHAHTVLDSFYFIPSRGDLPRLTSMQGDVTFHRENDKVYVKNNRVKALVLHANVPTVNGIIHIIDNLLYFVYMNIVQTIQRLPNTQTFKLYLEKDSNLKSFLESTTSNKTVFVPTDTAFAKLPTSKQDQLNSDLNLLSKVLGNHVVDGDYGENTFTHDMMVVTYSSTVIRIVKTTNNLFIETGGLQLTLEETDIGCTNGVIHLVSNVMLIQDFTVWDAITGNDQLVKMKNFIETYSDLSDILQNPSLHLTVFLPFDFVMGDIPGTTLNTFTEDPDILYNAISGHIILGHVMTSFNISSTEMFYTTYGGHKLGLLKPIDGDITVKGSNIQAKVIIPDITCSNGVVHIINNLMHIPTRNILDEIKRHPQISVISSFIGLYTMERFRSILSSEDKAITMFVPTNQAFNDIPRARADKLLMDSLLLERILQAHVVTSGSHLVEQLYGEQNLISEEDTIYVKRSNQTVGLVSNNVHSTITRSNVMATNGIIHMVDRVLYYPYFTVAETMSRDPRLEPFFDLMYGVDEFLDEADSDDDEMTVFVPSVSSLTNITSSSSLLTQLYLGHVLPGVKLDQRYLRNKNYGHISEKSTNNVTFNLKNETIGFSIDVGYSNLRYYFNIISDGIACSNGIIYVIEGLLNYNTRPLMTEIQQDNNLLSSLNFMFNLWPNGSKELLQDTLKQLTLFLPTKSIIDNLSSKQLTFLKELSNKEKEQIFKRHVIENYMYDMNNVGDSFVLENNITVQRGHDEVFLHWNKTISKVIRLNILSSNGIIHTIDNLFIDLPEPPTTAPPGTTKKSSHTNSANLNIHSVTFAILSLFLTLLLTWS